MIINVYLKTELTEEDKKCWRNSEFYKECCEPFKEDIDLIVGVDEQREILTLMIEELKEQLENKNHFKVDNGDLQ